MIAAEPLNQDRITIDELSEPFSIFLLYSIIKSNTLTEVGKPIVVDLPVKLSDNQTMNFLKDAVLFLALVCLSASFAESQRFGGYQGYERRSLDDDWLCLLDGQMPVCLVKIAQDDKDGFQKMGCCESIARTCPNSLVSCNFSKFCSDFRPCGARGLDYEDSEPREDYADDGFDEDAYSK